MHALSVPRFHTSPVLDAIGVRHGFTGRQGGVSAGRFTSLNLGASWGDEPEKVERNRQLLAAEAGFTPEALCQVIQVHGTRVLVLDGPERRQREADGMATAQPLVLGVLSADCVGLLLADGRGRVAAAHAGWRGTVADMAGAAVRALQDLGARTAEVRAALGPSIGPCCFEVQEDVAGAFRQVVPEAVLVDRDRRLRVDLWAAHRELLRRAGVPPQHIDAAPPCTSCDPQRYFSYRRDGSHIGQQLAFIMGGQR